MSQDWENDDWDDEYNEEPDEEETGCCPECGAEMLVDAEVCSGCGYWLSTAERHALWSGESRVAALKGVGKFVLIIVLIALMSGFMLL